MVIFLFYYTLNDALEDVLAWSASKICKTSLGLLQEDPFVLQDHEDMKRRDDWSMTRPLPGSQSRLEFTSMPANGEDKPAFLGHDLKRSLTHDLTIQRVHRHLRSSNDV